MIPLISCSGINQWNYNLILSEEHQLLNLILNSIAMGQSDQNVTKLTPKRSSVNSEKQG